MDATLRYIYFNPKSPAYLGSIREIYAYAKKLKPKQITVEKVKQWLNKQNVYTLHKPVKRKFARNKTIPLGLDTDWQADLIDMTKIKKKNRNYTFLLSVIDVLSKFGWAVPVFNKTAEEIIRGMKWVLKKSGRKPWHLFTDAGKEFVNKKFAKFLEEQDIKHLIARNKETKAAVAERYNRSIKEKLWKFFTQKQTFSYLKILPSIVKSINARYCRSTGMKPIDVTTDNERDVWLKQYGVNKKATRFIFKKGDKVRIAKEKNTFEKGYEPNFTKEIFTISKCLDRKPAVYVINDNNGKEIKGVFYGTEMVKYNG